MSVVRMADLDLAGKRVLIREDLNVPVKDGKVTSDARIRASLPTVRAAQEAGAAVMLMSHLGRPTEGLDRWRRRGTRLGRVAGECAFSRGRKSL